MSGEEPAPIAEPLPDPPKAEGVGARVSNMVSYLSEKGTEIIDKTKEKTKEGYAKAMENERVAALAEKTQTLAAQATEKAKGKYAEAMELERVKLALEKGQEYKEKIGERAAEYKEKIGEKTSELKSKLEEKTSEYRDKAKEAKEKTAEKTKALWKRGKGKIVKVRNEMGLAWGKTAQEILLQKEEAAKKWTDIKIRGAEDIVVSARSEFTTAYLVEKGTLMRWSFRVKDFDIGFGVRVRVMKDGGSVEEDVLPVERYDNVDTIEGSWVADEDSTTFNF
ncbi:unnamed protein product [Amoebophrya sp. A25]|nr:unnamed protein product [Amoebophrya sp. A25]|eukprot:GSA25T00027986001.1